MGSIFSFFRIHYYFHNNRGLMGILAWSFLRSTTIICDVASKNALFSVFAQYFFKVLFVCWLQRLSVCELTLRVHFGKYFVLASLNGCESPSVTLDSVANFSKFDIDLGK